MLVQFRLYQPAKAEAAQAEERELQATMHKTCSYPDSPRVFHACVPVSKSTACTAPPAPCAHVGVTEVCYIAVR